MTTLAPNPLAVLAQDVKVSAEALTVELSDGRRIAAPLAWFPRLQRATPAEHRHWRLIAGGRGIHWTDLDEDISVENLLLGQRSGESQASLAKWLQQRAAKRSVKSAAPSPRRRHV